VTIVAPADSCPGTAAVGEALAPLVPDTRIVDGAPVEVRVIDLGAAFRIEVSGQARAVDDAARNCAERAVTAAVFAAFVLDPPAAPAAPTADAAPARAVVTVPAGVVAVVPRPKRSAWHGALDASGVVAAAPGNGLVSGGGALRGAVGGDRVAAIAGVAVLSPATLAVGMESARLQRVPVDVGARVRLRDGELGIAGELGAIVSPLFVRGEGVAAPVSSTTLDLGLRAAVRAEWRRNASWVPFAGLEVVADTRHQLVTGDDASRSSPVVWVGVALGVEAAIF
jgi:hypothetical protein